MNYNGWALFCDGDMVCLDDISELFQYCDNRYAVMVVKHDYKTKAQEKYLGAKNEDYPRKNWSSVVLWNCSHPSNQQITPELVQGASGAFLHRFQWLKDDEIGNLPLEWNYLAEEYPERGQLKLIHYTLGTPCFFEYAACEMSEYWHNEYHQTVHCENSY